MIKRFLSLLICLSLILCALPFSVGEGEVVSAKGMDFDDRIIHGGLAVDVGDDVCYFENGSLFYWHSDIDKTEKILDIDGKYLNYYKEKLWFVSDNSIFSCDINGKRLETVKDFNTPISCLYVADGGMFYLANETVFSLSESGKEEAIFHREGMVGFAPMADGGFRWVVNNPQYTPVDESSGEVWQEGSAQYLSYITTFENGEEYDQFLGTDESQITATAEELADYGGPYVQVGDVRLPLENHMPGSFFSKNGKACTCHNTSSNYCIQSVGNCNCMRYYPTGYKETCEIDLLGAQCFAFARMIFYTCFGFIDHPMNESLYYSAGSLDSGKVTANSVKNLFMKAATGAHVRLAAGHSVSILTMDEDFVVIYHGNAGGNGVVSQPCIVSTRRYTWSEFASAASAGILYVNMPYNHPQAEEILTKKEVGYYKLTSNLRLRAETNTQSESLEIIPLGTIVTVTEIDGFWGKTQYNGKTGWVFLEYTTFQAPLGITPSGNSFALGDDGFLRGVLWNLTADSLSEHFAKQQLTITDASGKALSGDSAVGTGCVISISVDGKVIDKATVCLAGDINGNSYIDVGDYLMLRTHLLGKYSLTSPQSVSSDVNGDGVRDTFDYLAMRKYFFSEDASYFEDFKG